MQVSPVYHSNSTARVSQRPARLVASFQSSIHGTDDQASDAPWSRVGLVVAVHALQNVTQLTWLQDQQAGKPARRIRFATANPSSGRQGASLTSLRLAKQSFD